MAAAKGADGTPTKVRPLEVAVIGTGWRAECYFRVAHLLSSQVHITAVLARSEASAARAYARWGLKASTDLEAFARCSADVVIVSVPREEAPTMLRRLVAADRPVLCETPPAASAAELASLWADVGASGLIQVAEQYPYYPDHMARLALIAGGEIGTPTSVWVSSTQDYHAMALIRRYLNAGPAAARVRAQEFTAPIVDPLDPGGWEPGRHRSGSTTHATLDFGDGRLGVYEFTDNQWWNPVRPDLTVVRGVTGEIRDLSYTRLLADRVPVTQHLVRTRTGEGMNFEGHDSIAITAGDRILWSTAAEGSRLSDDELAIAELLRRTSLWLDGGPAPYPLAEACHDHALALAVKSAVRDGTEVAVEEQPWTAHLGQGV